MKHTILVLVTAALASCSGLTREQQAQIGLNLVKDANAAGLVYLTTGSGAAAALAAGAQVVKNHTPSAKNPKTVTP